MPNLNHDVVEELEAEIERLRIALYNLYETLEFERQNSADREAQDDE